MSATAGVAQFLGCSISPAYSGQYCLTASSSGLTSTPAACFSISNPATANNSTVVSSVVPPATVLDSGAATATITVTLKDSSGSPVSGKTVTLNQGAGTGSGISAGSNGGVSNASGVVTFTVTDTSAETVTYTAIDTSDGVTVAQTAQVIFQGGTISTSTSRSTVSAAPLSVTADGVSQSIITVTLQDGSSNPVSGATATLAQSVTTGTASSIITAVNGGITNSNGEAIFTVADATIQQRHLHSVLHEHGERLRYPFKRLTKAHGVVRGRHCQHPDDNADPESSRDLRIQSPTTACSRLRRLSRPEGAPETLIRSPST